LAAIAAALTACRLEIFAAQIYTRLAAASGEEELDVFWVRDRVHGAAGLIAIIPKVEQMFDEVLSGTVTPQSLLHKRVPTRWSDRPRPPVLTELNETKIGSRERVNQVKLQLSASLHRSLPETS
jgi:hypothetical protein